MTPVYVLDNTTNYEEVEFDIPDPTTQFKAIYANYDFSFQKSFYVYNEIANTIYDVTNINVTSHPEFTDVVVDSSNTITISKIENTTLFPETYDFIKFNSDFTESETVTYDLDDYETEEDPVSMIGWNTPDPESFANNYVIQLEYYNTNTSTYDTLQVTYEQEFHWDVNQSLPSFRNILNDSEY